MMNPWQWVNYTLLMKHMLTTFAKKKKAMGELSITPVGEKCCYPIWEKVVMGIHMQRKIILKMEGDGWKSIIYTAREMNTTIRIIIIAREYNLWAGDSSL